jgi:hypothetical protein
LIPSATISFYTIKEAIRGRLNGRQVREVAPRVPALVQQRRLSAFRSRKPL